MFVLGTAYYPDYLPDEVLVRAADGTTKKVNWQTKISEDFKRMRACGISAVRMGEFSWATVEPQPGRLNFVRFRYALDTAAVNDIRVIFCTPTACPPKWLIDRFPEFLPVTRDGRKVPFGSRRHYDICNSNYVAESKRITIAYAQEIGNHPAIIGWQVDNEFGCHGSAYSFTDHAKLAFRRWLQERYKGDIGELNREWFTCFWSQHYAGFDQIDLPLQSWADQNPHMELDYRRFSTEKVAAFQREQIEMIRRTSPNRFITHNFMTLFEDLNYWRLSEDLDVAGFDHYQMTEEPHPTTSHWQFALMRSLKRQMFFVLEQQPLQVNWQTTNRRYAYDWLFLWGIQASVLGAAAMYYFSWQKFPGGAEQYHDAVVPHDIRVPESWQERVIKSKRQLFDWLAQQFSISLAEPLAVAEDVLCIYDFESVWSHQITAQSQAYSTRHEIDFVAALCQSTGLGLSFARTILDAEELLKRFKCLILPGYAFELLEQERQLLERFLNNGGSVISFPRTAMKKRNNQMTDQPLFLFNPDDFYFEDYGALLPGEKELFEVGDQTFAGELWAEKIRIVNPVWQSLGSFIDGLYAGYPAVIQNGNFANGGRYTHLCACPQQDGQFIDWLSAAAGLRTPAGVNTELQIYPLIKDDKLFLAGLNFTQAEQQLNLSTGAGAGQVMLAQLDANQKLKVSSGDGGGSDALLIPARSFCLLQLA